MQESGIHLPIDIRGQINRGVAQLALDVGERFALLLHEARIGMPEAMVRKVERQPLASCACRPLPASTVLFHSVKSATMTGLSCRRCKVWGDRGLHFDEILRNGRVCPSRASSLRR